MATTSSKAMNEDRNLNRTSPGTSGSQSSQMGGSSSAPLKEKLGEASGGDVSSRENLSAIKEQATETMSNLRGRFGELTSQYRESAREYADNVNSYVRENPFRSLALGFGAGILLGALLSPRRIFR